MVFNSNGERRVVMGGGVGRWSEKQFVCDCKKIFTLEAINLRSGVKIACDCKSHSYVT